MAEFMVIDDPRHLVPLEGLDPVATVPLTDAGLTPYHAIKRSLPKLVPGSAAVVIGVGGLGHVAIQLLRALTATRVIALDVGEEKLALAREVGAHETVLSDSDAAASVRELTSGRGADAIFDFVGIESTVQIAGAAAAVEAEVTIIGLGGAGLSVGWGHLFFGVSVVAPFWGGLDDFHEVIDLARTGAVSIHTETYSLDEAPLAYERLHAGKVNGRAVILPNG
jgi:propanol-preferring alcohol dehydrogenase